MCKIKYTSTQTLKDILNNNYLSKDSKKDYWDYKDQINKVRKELTHSAE